MPREREFETDAERQAAYRERKRLEADLQAAEDAYVAEMMKLPPLVATGSKEHPQTFEERLAAARGRQEAYARWRFKAYRTGEVASL